jgi:hypothetical protein
MLGLKLIILGKTIPKTNQSTNAMIIYMNAVLNEASLGNSCLCVLNLKNLKNVLGRNAINKNSINDIYFKNTSIELPKASTTLPIWKVLQYCFVVKFMYQLIISRSL